MVFSYNASSLKKYLDPDNCRTFELKADIHSLLPGYKKALPKLIKAAALADTLFLIQDNPQSLPVKKQLEEDVTKGIKNADLALEVFKMFNGPEGINYENETVPLFEGVLPRPKGGTLYPEGLTAEEIETYLQKHPEKSLAFKKINTLIERKNQDFLAIPYEKKYSPLLKKIASLLESAAQDVPDKKFSKYLQTRAKALLTGDFFESDASWIHSTTSPIDFIIGPLESYGDRILGKKSFYAGLLCIKNTQESERVAEYIIHLQELEETLPQEKTRTKQMKTISLPVAVVDILYISGDYQAKRPGITVGQTLPNDKEVLEKIGRKILIYKNILEGFTPNQELLKKLINPSMHPFLTPRAKVNFVVSHEVSHSLGPKQTIRKDSSGKLIAVDTALENWDAIIEELKSDTVGMYNLPLLVEKEVYTQEEMHETFVDGALMRSLPLNRPDIHKDAHRVGDLIKFNWYFTHKVLLLKEGKFTLDLKKFYEVNKNLVSEIIKIQAEGNKNKAEDFIRTWSFWPEEAAYAAKVMKECKVKLYKTVKQTLAEEILKNSHYSSDTTPSNSQL